MKTRNLFLTGVWIFFVIGLNAQTGKPIIPSTPDTKKTAPVIPGQPDPKSQKSDKDQPVVLISANGFAHFVWGENYKTVEEKLIGKLKYKQDGEFIYSDLGEFTIKYGFFRDENQPVHKTNAPNPANNSNTPQKPEVNQDPKSAGKPDQKQFMTDDEIRQKQMNENARLFFVTLELPYILSEKIEQRVAAKLGSSKGRQVEKNRGLVWWETEQTLIIVWMDAVEGKSYTRKVDFIGKKIRDEIRKKQQEIDEKKQRSVLKDLNF